MAPTAMPRLRRVVTAEVGGAPANEQLSVAGMTGQDARRYSSHGCCLVLLAPNSSARIDGTTFQTVLHHQSHCQFTCRQGGEAGDRRALGPG